MKKQTLLMALLAVLSSNSYSESYLLRVSAPGVLVINNNKEEVVGYTVLAEVKDGFGQELSGLSKVISTNNYLNRDFLTFFNSIAGHGPLHGSFEIVLDAGESNAWLGTGFEAKSISSTYPYFASGKWFMSDDLESWTEVASITGGLTPVNITISNVKKRYLKINHDVQPLNKYSLSYIYYNNLDLKIIKVK